MSVIFEIKDLEIIPTKPLLNKFANFMIRVFKKIIESLISVKIWGLAGITAVCTWLVVKSYITGGNFATVEVSLITTVFGMRESYKIAQIWSAGKYKQINDSNNLNVGFGRFNNNGPNSDPDYKGINSDLDISKINSGIETSPIEDQSQPG